MMVVLGGRGRDGWMVARRRFSVCFMGERRHNSRC